MVPEITQCLVNSQSPKSIHYRLNRDYWRVSSHRMESQMTYLVQREYKERSAPARFYDDGNESGIDSAEGTVPGHSRNPNVIVTLVILHCLPKHMPKLALSYHSPHRVCGRTKSKLKSCPWEKVYFYKWRATSQGKKKKTEQYSILSALLKGGQMANPNFL